MKDFTREELQVIGKRAEQLADIVVNPHWKRALLRLTDAAMVVDAYTAMTEDNDG